MRATAIFLTLSLLTGSAFGQAGTAPDVVLVPDDDKEINAAMEQARKSVEDFVKVFQARKPGQSRFAVKVAIRDGKQVEHFWAAVSKFDGEQFEGVIRNDPMLVKNVKDGDPVKVAKGKISDWMYVENQKLVGGYTIRALRKQLSPAERKELDASVPYKIE